MSHTTSDGVLDAPEAVADAIRATKDDAWEASIRRWIRHSLETGPLDTLYAKWMCAVMLWKGWGLDMALWLEDFAREVRLTGRWTVKDVNRVWPKDTQYDVRQVINSCIMYGRYVPYVDRFGESTIRLRSGWNARVLRNATRGLTIWTSSQYQDIQDWLRKGVNVAGGRALAEQMMEYFKRPVYRVPRSPVPHVTELYRGIHGQTAAQFQVAGVAEDRGFLAFTWNKEIAQRFARGGSLLRLSVRNIPTGTPWVWFDQQHQPASGSTEQEVLLLPGRLRIAAAVDETDVLPVSYEPL